MNSNNRHKISLEGAWVLLFTLLFVTLKLTHQVEWSWLWVLSPLWIPIAFVLIIAILAFLIYGVLAGLAMWTSKK